MFFKLSYRLLPLAKHFSVAMFSPQCYLTHRTRRAVSELEQQKPGNGLIYSLARLRHKLSTNQTKASFIWCFVVTMVTNGLFYFFSLTVCFL